MADIQDKIEVGIPKHLRVSKRKLQSTLSKALSAFVDRSIRGVLSFLADAIIFRVLMVLSLASLD